MSTKHTNDFLDFYDKGVADIDRIYLKYGTPLLTILLGLFMYLGKMYL